MNYTMDSLDAQHLIIGQENHGGGINLFDFGYIPEIKIGETDMKGGIKTSYAPDGTKDLEFAMAISSFTYYGGAAPVVIRGLVPVTVRNHLEGVLKDPTKNVKTSVAFSFKIFEHTAQDGKYFPSRWGDTLNGYISSNARFPVGARVGEKAFHEELGIWEVQLVVWPKGANQLHYDLGGTQKDALAWGNDAAV
jgi:hypothetical protein